MDKNLENRNLSEQEQKIVDLKQEILELKNQIEYEKQKSEGKNRFLSKISYDLRTSLDVIAGVSEYNSDMVYSLDHIQESFDKIEICTSRLSQVVDSIIDYAAVENENITLVSEQVDLGKIVSELTLKYYLLAKETGKQFETQIDGIIDETVIGDEKRVIQVITCILDNIFIRMPENTSVSCKLYQPSTSNGKSYIRFVFSADGDEDNLKEIRKIKEFFLPELEELESSTFWEDHFEIMICCKLIKMMKGTVSWKDEINSMIMNLDLEFEKCADTKRIETSELFADEKVLIAGDSVESCENRGKMLSAMNLPYDIATTEDDALDKIGEAESEGAPYKLCIIDWNANKTVMSNFVHDARMLFGRSMVIVATAYDVDGCIKRARQLGIDYVIEKTWFRSTIFNVLMKIRNSQNRNQKEENNDEQIGNYEGRRVLVAEDAVLNMDVIERLLRKGNITVERAANGMEAVRLFEKKPSGFFDLILMDINMPVLDGYEATRRIRSIDREDAKTIPIYAMTANAFQEDIADALDAGMDGHIAKPIDVQVLYRTIDKIFADNTSNQGKGLRTQELERRNKELQEKLQRDPLTGLLNRYGYERVLDEYRYSSTPMGFMIVDIDHFKTINDTYGHEIGDLVLKKIAHILREQFRTSDRIIRFGGDEFVVVFYNTTDDRNFIGKKVDRINQYLKENDGELPVVSISAGIAFSRSGYHNDLYSMADKALYEVKNNGRCGYKVSAEELSELDENMLQDKSNKSLYKERMFYLKGDHGSLLEHGQTYVDMILENNQAVGVVEGFFDQGKPVYAISRFALRALGYNYMEFLEDTDGKFEELIYPDDKDILFEDVEEDILYNHKIRFVHKKGEILWFYVTLIVSHTKEGKKIWISSIRKMDEYVISALCDMDFAVIGIINGNRDYITLEKSMNSLYGYELETHQKYNYTSLVEHVTKYHIDEVDGLNFESKASLTVIRQKLKQNGLYEFVAYHPYQDGTSRAIRHKFRYLDEEKELILYTQEWVERWAQTDDLTDLLNEQGFYINASEFLDNTKQDYYILKFNIMDFKGWNELLGHVAADEVLKAVAKRLRNSILQPVALAHTHADKYLALVEKEKLSFDVINELCNGKIKIGNNSIYLRMHCGIYFIDDRSQDIRSMCDKAKIAETQVNNELAASYYVYDSKVDEAYHNQISVLSNMNRGMEKNQFHVYYQPVYDVKTEKIASAEALVRWIMHGNHVVSPQLFIPALEKKGHIADLDYFIADSVHTFLEERKREGKFYVPVSMNLSRMDFLNEKFLDQLTERVKASDLRRDYLRFEVTESAYVDVDEQGNMLLDQLRKSGSKVLIDDFGTGYSTLENLLEIEFDILKLDMVFVKKIGIDRAAEEIIKSVIQTCHKMGKKIIAEGVETQEQFLFLKENDCDYVQGYYFSKPLPQEEFMHLLDV